MTCARTEEFISWAVTRAWWKTKLAEWLQFAGGHFQVLREEDRMRGAQWQLCCFSGKFKTVLWHRERELLEAPQPKHLGGNCLRAAWTSPFLKPLALMGLYLCHKETCKAEEDPNLPVKPVLLMKAWEKTTHPKWIHPRYGSRVGGAITRKQ